MSETAMAFIPGDIYEDGFGHPCLCVEVNLALDEIWGISLIDGSYPRSCSLLHSGIHKLTVAKAWAIKMTHLLKCAIKDGNIVAVLRLLEESGILEAWSDDDFSILSVAVLGERIDILKALLDYGVDPNIENRADGGTALMCAALKDRDDMARLLLAAGARIDKTYWDRDDHDALIVAAKTGSVRVLALLIQRGANVSRITKWGATALMEASLVADQPQVIDTLIKAGADPNQVVPGRWNALDCAVMYGRINAARVLRQQGAVIQSGPPYPEVRRG